MSTLLMKNIRNEEGFSLLELSMVIIITGFIIAGAAQYYQIYLRQSKDAETFEDIQLIRTAVAEYYTNHGRYPCPTDPSLPYDDPNYGLEMCPGRNVAGVAVPNLALDACWGRLCRVESERSVDLDGDGTDDPQAVLVGGFPYRQMLREMDVDPTDIDPTDGIDMMPVDYDFPGEQTLDSFANKFVYAVTETMTDQTTYNNNMGAVTIKDEFDESLVEPPDTAHYAVVSLGENGRGAYNIYGNLVGQDCDPSTVPATYDPMNPSEVSQASIEYENCNSDSVFVSALKNEEQGDSFNDDMVGFEVWAATELWSPSPVNPVHIYNINVGNVGVGVIDPAERFDVEGDIQASDVLAQQICDLSTGLACFDASAIGGQIADGEGMSCPAGSIMTGIELGGPICEEILPATTSFTGSCPAGPPKQYAVGVRTDGSIICETL